MLYLLKSTHTIPSFIYKVGYAENIKNRFNSYKSSNPSIELISQRKGTYEDEQLLHLYLTSIGYRLDTMKEWYLDRSDILEHFQKSFSDIKKYIWDNRNTIFSGRHLWMDKKNTVGTFKFYLLRELINLFLPEDPIYLNKDNPLLHSTLSKLDSKIVDLYKSTEVISLSGVTEKEKESISSFLSEFNKDQEFIRRMRLYCEFFDKNENPNITTIINQKIPTCYSNYYIFYGTDKLRTYGYQESILLRGFENTINSTNLSSEIYKVFEEGKKYTLSHIKTTITSIYISLNITKSPKATDLREFFEYKSILIPNSITNKREGGFKLIKKKL